MVVTLQRLILALAVGTRVLRSATAPYDLVFLE
jgi:hypothetical protein